MGIGTKIRQVRELRGFSQEFVAEKLGLTQGSYGRLERGETDITVKRLEELAKVLDVPADELLKFDCGTSVFHTTNHGSYNNIGNYGTVIHNLEKELYENQIEALKSEVANLKKIVELLEER